MKIVDCFTFFNELDLLEFRLKLLDQVVDYFVLSESNLTFSGKSKPYYFEENKSRFEKWLPKIIHIKASQTTEGMDFSVKETSYNPQSAAFRMEHQHRNTLSQAATVINDEDIVLLGDIDEIPDLFKLKKLKLNDGPVALSLLFHYYFLNCQNIGHERWWNGSIASTGKQFKATLPQALRDKRNELPVVKKAGWHFSYLGGLEKIKEKIRSFAHTEFNKEEFLKDENILKAMEEGKDIFKRPGVHYRFFPLAFYPDYLRKLMLQYPGFLHLKRNDNLWEKIYFGLKNL